MNAYPVSEMLDIQGIYDPSMLNPVSEKLLIESNQVSVTGGYHHKDKPHIDKPWFQKNSETLPNIRNDNNENLN